MAPDDTAQFFKSLKKCQRKFDCLIFEMFFIKELKLLFLNILSLIFTYLHILSHFSVDDI